MSQTQKLASPKEFRDFVAARGVEIELQWERQAPELAAQAA